MKTKHEEPRESPGCIMIPAFLIILLIILISCEYYREQPFVIVGKTYKDKIIEYQYQDKDGHDFLFQELYEKYQIGDTIK